MRVLLDTRIIIDYLEQRKDFLNDANIIFELISDNKFTSYITVKSLTDIYYIVHHLTHDTKKSKDIIKNLLITTISLDINENHVINALDSKINDYEDAIMDENAYSNSIDYIITRNIKDFKNSKTKIISPKDFIKLF